MRAEEIEEDIPYVAVIGLAGRFPGSPNIEVFWDNLSKGVESVSFFNRDELLAMGVPPETISMSSFVGASSKLDDFDQFDADFFNFTPREAEITDPQQRLLLECSYHALEHAGYDPDTTEGRIGAYVGVGSTSYLFNNVGVSSEHVSSVGMFQLLLANEGGYAATRLGYKLNLKGPCVSVNTACSTSLVAVHQACASLLAYESDVVLAGASHMGATQRQPGYIHQKGGVLSVDGHTRTFDAKGSGTIAGEGAGVIVLKRLDDALEDGDTIHAVIKGSAINNDGNQKIGFTAPSIEGQTTVISEALANAQVEPETITSIEAHGTATALGDPIEFAALSEVFKNVNPNEKTCALGSVKTNIGHLDTASGMAGLIKTILSLKHRTLPPSLNYETRNTKIDLDSSPFYVNTRLSDWEPINGIPRRAGVSSFGVGGTNAHVVLEEAPEMLVDSSRRDIFCICCSANSKKALKKLESRYVEHAKESPDDIADIAYTSQVGRKHLSNRSITIVSQKEGLVFSRVYSAEHDSITKRKVAFLFPGQGSQYWGMAKGLYENEPVFRETLTRCSDILEQHLHQRVEDILYSNSDRDAINNTIFTQPVLFSVEYSLACLYQSFGVQPDLMLGHSIGEYVAACIAGVFSLEDALHVVSVRGRLVQNMPSGSMLAIQLSHEQIATVLSDYPRCDLAAENALDQYVVSGPECQIKDLESALRQQGTLCKKLTTSHAFHSSMLEPARRDFVKVLSTISLSAPKTPFVSNVTGSLIRDDQAVDPEYWGEQLQKPVLFHKGIQTLASEPGVIFLEVGLGQTISQLAKKSLARKGDGSKEFPVINCAGPSPENDEFGFVQSIGQLWCRGVSPDWLGFYEGEQRHRVPLPEYPFDHKSYWVEPDKNSFNPKNVEPSYFEEQKRIPKENEEVIEGEKQLNETERSLTRLWVKSLGIKNIKLKDDFFALGGSSLLAVQIISKIQEMWSVELDEHVFLNAPTVELLAKLIEASSPNKKESAELPESLVLIQEGEPKKPPIFFVHPVGGHVYFYRSLAKALGEHKTVYGFQAAGLQKENSSHTSIEDMAIFYIDALKKVQPEGPYFLAGASFGGTVAFEMAVQLTNNGDAVPFLCLMDTPGVGQMPTEMSTETEILAYLGASISGDPKYSKESLEKIEKSKRVNHFVQWVREEGLLPDEINDEDVSRFLDVFSKNMNAMIQYKPKSYTGNVLFFRAKERREKYDPKNPERGWIDYAEGGISIKIVPGNHITMMDSPNNIVLANEMSKEISRVLLNQQYC
ncbi:MAG: acyltransferase domain-containing protein [Agarilytica sp.]